MKNEDIERAMNALSKQIPRPPSALTNDLLKAVNRLETERLKHNSTNITSKHNKSTGLSEPKKGKNKAK